MGRKAPGNFFQRNRVVALIFLIFCLLTFVFWRIGSDKYAEHVDHDVSSLKKANQVISDLRKQVDQLNLDLEKAGKRENALKLEVGQFSQLKSEVDSCQKEIEKWKGLEAEARKQLKGVQGDLNEWKKRPHPDKVSHELLEGVIASLAKEKQKYKDKLS